MSKKVIVTSVSQQEAKLIERDDVEDKASYDYNKPSDDWVLIEYKTANGPKRLWTSKRQIETPLITDHTKVKIQVGI